VLYQRYHHPRGELGSIPYFDDREALDSRSGDRGLDKFRVFDHYLDKVSDRITKTAGDNDMPLAEVQLDKRYSSRDEVHPNYESYELITEQSRKVGYSPVM
jgi:hypothetical protein